MPRKLYSRFKAAPNFKKFLKVAKMLEKNLVFFHSTTFSLILNLFFSKTNSHSKRLFFELDFTVKLVHLGFHLGSIYHLITFLVYPVLLLNCHGWLIAIGFENPRKSLVQLKALFLKVPESHFRKNEIS